MTEWDDIELPYALDESAIKRTFYTVAVALRQRATMSGVRVYGPQYICWNEDTNFFSILIDLTTGKTAAMFPVADGEPHPDKPIYPVEWAGLGGAN